MLQYDWVMHENKLAALCVKNKKDGKRYEPFSNMNLKPSGHFRNREIVRRVGVSFFRDKTCSAFHSSFSWRADYIPCLLHMRRSNGRGLHFCMSLAGSDWEDSSIAHTLNVFHLCKHNRKRHTLHCGLPKYHFLLLTAALTVKLYNPSPCSLKLKFPLSLCQSIDI